MVAKQAERHQSRPDGGLVRPGNWKRTVKRNLDGIVTTVVLTPYGLLLTAFTLCAVAVTVFLSFTNIDLLDPGPIKMVGLSNYRQAFDSSVFWSSVELTVFLLIVPVVLQVLLGLCLAVLVDRMAKSGVIQTILLLPMFLPPVVAGLLWRMIFTPDFQGLDYALSSLGLNAPAWLGHSGTAVAAVTIVDVWQWLPFAFIFLLSAVRALPTEPYEAARVDGANELQMFIHITIPMLRRPLTFAALFEVVNYAAVLGVIYAMTNGGPGTATETLDLNVFDNAFESLNVSFAAALLVCLLLIMLIPGLALARQVVHNWERR
jgi:multiple sugar transport system permease protein